MASTKKEFSFKNAFLSYESGEYYITELSDGEETFGLSSIFGTLPHDSPVDIQISIIKRVVGD